VAPCSAYTTRGALPYNLTLTPPLEALYELLRHKYARERACGALRLAVQLGGARFGKEQRLSSSHIVDLAGAELLVAAPQPTQLTSQFSVSHRQRPQSTTRCKDHVRNIMPSY